jgi:hypothetical protein
MKDFKITYLSILSTPPNEERKEGRKERPDSVGD